MRNRIEDAMARALIQAIEERSSGNKQLNRIGDRQAFICVERGMLCSIA